MKRGLILFDEQSWTIPTDWQTRYGWRHIAWIKNKLSHWRLAKIYWQNYLISIFLFHNYARNTVQVFLSLGLCLHPASEPQFEWLWKNCHAVVIVLRSKFKIQIASKLLTSLWNVFKVLRWRKFIKPQWEVLHQPLAGSQTVEVSRWRRGKVQPLLESPPGTASSLNIGKSS